MRFSDYIISGILLLFCSVRVPVLLKFIFFILLNEIFSDIFLTFHFVYVGGYIFVPFTLDFFSLRNNVAALFNRKIL